MCGGCQEFDVDGALRTFINNNGIKPDEFESEEIERYGFHGTQKCRVGEGPDYPSTAVTDAAADLRHNIKAGQMPLWYKIIGLHVIREHGEGEFGANFQFLVDYHTAALIDAGVVLE